MAILWVGLVIVLATVANCQEYEMTIKSGSGSIAWCRQNEKNEWRHLLGEMFSGTAIKITETDCTDIGGGGLGVLITHSDGVQEMFTRKVHQNIQNFIASVLRKMSKEFIISITEISEWDSLPTTVEFIVLYTHYRDCIEHVLFQQAALTGRIPEDSILVTVHDVELLPIALQEKATSSFHVWLVEGMEWNNLHLNTYHLTNDQIREEFVGLMSRLKYAALHVYDGEDPQKLYHDSGLNLLMLFHETHQLEELVNDIIQPLVKEFRSFYVFVTMDVTEYPNLKQLYKIDANETTPYIIVTDPRYDGGLHLDKKSIAYTSDRLRNYLKSLVIPENHKNTTNARFKDEGVFLFDPHTLGVLTEEQADTVLLVAFCEKDTPTCNELYNELSKAVKEALTDHGSRLDMLLCVTVTEDLEEIAQYPVNKLPAVLLRYQGIWEEITDTQLSNYVEIIKKFGRMIDEQHDEL